MHRYRTRYPEVPFFYPHVVGFAEKSARTALSVLLAALLFSQIYSQNIVILYSSARGGFWLSGRWLKLQGHWRKRSEGGLWVDVW